MDKHTDNWFTKKIGLDYDSNDKNIWIENGYVLRRIIGILGILLPFLLWFFLFVATNHTKPLPSISHYYYTRVDGLFLIILGVLALFLIIYKGYKPIDFYFSVTAGISAFCFLLFPTSSIMAICSDETFLYSNTILASNPAREIFHYASAGIFLSCLAFMSIFIFTKTDKAKGEMKFRKLARNWIYRFCGIVMVLSLMGIVSRGCIIEEGYYDSHQLTFWFETIAVMFFGVSWLIKGEVVCKDKVEDQ